MTAVTSMLFTSSQAVGLDLPLAHDEASPALARRVAREVLGEWGLSEDAVYDALVIISELTTNAIEHALPPVMLYLRPTELAGHPSVLIDVTDGGPAPCPGHWAASCSSSEHGRGNAIVAALSEQDGYCETSQQSDHWAVGPRSVLSD
ncbi:ATP-binding protein [Streptomyces nigra]|uniref:ATP-binding protein n=1 Tax=Streptomyces nigra TaxID=1827580 RepID=UPI0037D11F9F